MKSMLYNLRINDLEFLENKLQINIKKLGNDSGIEEKRILSYITSYPFFIDFFNEKKNLTKKDLVIGANFIYAWMPTVFVWKNNNFSEVLALLNKVKNKNTLLSKEEFLNIKSLINDSTVGTAKILHFTNPALYPIWDSKVNVLLGGNKKDTNSLELYFQYLSIFKNLVKKKNAHIITKKISSKIGYEISFARAFEMILFLSDSATLKETKSIESNIGNELKIPRYKRDQFIFISNLKKFTANPEYPITYNRDGYLLSEHYMTKTSIRLAAEVKSRRNLLISDNGNFTRIKRIASKFDDRGLDILNTARKEKIDFGEVSEETKARRIELINIIGEESKVVTNSLDIGQITSKQLSIEPDYMIGMEDFAIPAMMLCNLMHPVFNPEPQQILEYQQRTLDVYSKQNQGLFGNKELLKKTANFLVLHAYDYSSAFQAGQNSKQINKDGIAISYGSPMLSNRWINSLDFGGNVEMFGEKLPESYLIAQSITLGVVNSDSRLNTFHILGVGTPILIALIGYQLRHAKAVSIDSTAPFKDAFDGNLYGDKSGYIKMDMYKVAAYHLVKGTPFTSSTPYFQYFNERFPSNWDKLRELLNILPTTDIKKLSKELKSHLETIEKYIPFFSKMRSGDDDMIKILRICRAGHNFWVLRRICKKIIRKKDDPVAFKAWIEGEVDRYTKIASPKWAKAVERTFELTEKYRQF